MTAKRLLDVVAAAAGLLILSPLLAAIALCVRVSDGGPALFTQTRIGHKGRPFRILKFRSMGVDAATKGPSITAGGDDRVTPIGRFLRRTKLDELPQLWNVLRGDMSLVGPRPEVPKYVALYSPAQRAVLELVPGITDAASLAFIDEEAILAAASDPHATYVGQLLPEKIRLNLEYARRASLASDLRLIVATIFHSQRPRRAGGR